MKQQQQSCSQALAQPPPYPKVFIGMQITSQKPLFHPKKKKERDSFIKAAADGCAADREQHEVGPTSWQQPHGQHSVAAALLLFLSMALDS